MASPPEEVQNREIGETLVREHYVPLYRFLHHMTRRRDEASDLVQQTFIRALRNLNQLDPESSPRSWLYAIAYREFLNWRRRRLWLPLVADRPSAEDRFSQVHDSHVLLNALGDLKPDSRVVFLLHYVEEQSIQEIAKMLNIPEGTVKSRLHTARTSLKALLKEDEPYVPEFI